jgi:hypothetical protein
MHSAQTLPDHAEFGVDTSQHAHVLDVGDVLDRSAGDEYDVGGFADLEAADRRTVVRAADGWLHETKPRVTLCV